jgi:hypothetical protein
MLSPITGKLKPEKPAFRIISQPGRISIFQVFMHPSTPGIPAG